MEDIQSWITQYQNGIYAFAATVFVFYILRAFVIGRLVVLSKRTRNKFDDVIIDVIKSLNIAFALTIAFLIGWHYAGMTFEGVAAIKILIILIITHQLTRASRVIFEHIISNIKGGKKGASAIHTLRKIVKIILWLGGGVMIMATLGYNVSSIVAGLGVGGIAIALALQNILSDLFSSFSIYFDKPFAVGDYIITGDQEGEVEKIGLKTTRIRSLRGEEIIVSNRELTNGIIQNFGTLKRRRVLDNLTLTYETSNKKLNKLPEALQKIIDNVQDASFDRIHFKSFGSSALEFELVYYIESNDYLDFVRIQHEVNMDMKTWFEKQKINFAYPTQTVYHQKA